MISKVRRAPNDGEPDGSEQTITKSPMGVSKAFGFANYVGRVTDERSEEGTSPTGL